LRSKVYLDAIKRLFRDLQPLSKKYGISRAYLFAEAAYCYVFHGSSAHEYINFEFYKLSDRERRKFVTMRSAAQLEKLLNDRQYTKYFDDKKLFNEYFRSFIYRDWIYSPNMRDDEIINFIKIKRKVIVKPNSESQGRGVFVVTTEEDHLANVHKLVEEIKRKNCLIEEFIEQHPEVSLLNPSSVNSIRVYTLIDSMGRSHVIFAAIRVGSSNGHVDNYHSGGVAYPIDLEDGVVNGFGRDLKNNPYLYHPSTGVQMIGYKIPNWNIVKETVLEASLLIPQCRYIGWDVAITKSGCELIEGNSNPGPELLQTLDKEGKKDVFTRMK